LSRQVKEKAIYLPFAAHGILSITCLPKKDYKIIVCFVTYKLRDGCLNLYQTCADAAAKKTGQQIWKHTTDMEVYNRGGCLLLMLADILTDGIVKQFPDNFRN
jgi:hypothetical protein